MTNNNHSLDFIILQSKNAGNGTKKKEVIAREKTNCFGGFCSGFRVKLASKLPQRPTN
jgi:hypothetical protein